MLNSRNIKLSEDGKYKWTYELNLYKRPKNLFLLLKIFGWLWFLFFLMMVFITLQTNDKAPTPPREVLLLCLLLYACCALGLAALYYMVAWIRGGKRFLAYEMDEEGITKVRGTVRKLTRFAEVKKIRGNARHGEITLKTGLTKKRVYTAVEDFEQVLGYMKEKRSI